MSDFNALNKILKKASEGEGSKGGNIVGHTSTGKPIYGNSQHEGHSTFNSREHRDALNTHHEIWSKTNKKIQKLRSEKTNWNPPKPIHDFIRHHYTQMRMHQNRASSAEAREKRLQDAKKVKKSHEETIPSHSAVVVINPDRTKYLLGKRWRDDIWTPPAGGAHLGEFPIDTAIRETFEESNIMLQKEQLIELPMLYAKHLKPVYCYLAVLNKDQMKKITEVNDPDEEIKKWKWFDLEGPRPEPIDDKRFNTILNAKIKLAEMMQKSYLPLDDMEGMTTISTGDFAQERNSDRFEQDLIEQHMVGFSEGDEPRQIPLDGSVLYLVRVDDGMFSGFVKRIDKDGLQETVASIDKMTIPALTQFLRAKQVIKELPLEKPKEDNNLRRLLDLLSAKNAEKMIYVSMDGDAIGNKVAQAEALDDEDALREFSRRINAGQTLFSTWAHSVGGEIIEGGGDEALAKVPESSKSKIEFFRAQYAETVQATVTVGVGDSISQATKARELGKLKGKNRTEVFIPGKSDEELLKLFKHVDEAQKIRDSGVLNVLKSFALEGAPHGTVRNLYGKKWLKEKSGHWLPIEGDAEDETHFTRTGTEPSDSNRPQAALSQDANSMAVAKPGDKPLPKGSNSSDLADDHVGKDKKLTEFNEKLKKTPTDHLKPDQPGRGGHVELHSSDLRNVLKNGPASIVSGGRNSHSKDDRGLTDEDVKGRHKRLGDDLKNQGFKFTRAKGKYGEDSESYIVHHGEPKHINDIAKKYQQHSVIHLKDGKSEMHYLSGPKAGKRHKGEGYTNVPEEAKDNYTEVGTSDGKRRRFMVNLDFDKLHGDD